MIPDPLFDFIGKVVLVTGGTVALGRPGNPGEIATAPLMLASQASTYTIEALLRVDGGQQ